MVEGKIHSKGSVSSHHHFSYGNIAPFHIGLYNIYHILPNTANYRKHGGSMDVHRTASWALSFFWLSSPCRSSFHMCHIALLLLDNRIVCKMNSRMSCSFFPSVTVLCVCVPVRCSINDKPFYFITLLYIAHKWRSLSSQPNPYMFSPSVCPYFTSVWVTEPKLFF